MAQVVEIRSLKRGLRLRVKNSAGTVVTLSATANTKVDLDDVDVRRQLSHHSAIGQFIVVGAPTPV